MRRYSFQRKQPLILMIFIVLVGLGAGIFGFKTLAGNASSIVSPLGDLKNIPFLKDGTRNTRDSSELIDDIKEFIDQQNGTYSVYIFDINENTGFGINETTIFTAASINKVPILAVLYYEAQLGAIDLDERITIQANDIQDYGTGIIRYQEPGTVYSIKSLAQLMIEKSDNTAAYILSQRLGTKKIQERVNEWGLVQTDITENKTSNRDLATLMVKLYKGQVTNKALTEEMVGFMDDSDFENRIPALLPKTIPVYHKIGTEVGNIHDAGIIVLPDRPFYLGVLTNDVSDEPTTEAAIAQIAKIAFDYMSSE